MQSLVIAGKPQRQSVPARLVSETQIALLVMMYPDRSQEIDASLLSPRTRELVECVQLAPRWCKEIGPEAFFGCVVDINHAIGHPLLEYVVWLLQTPAEVRALLPDFDSVVRTLGHYSHDAAA